MTMSKRRFQFLDQLVELYQKTRLPIHYETLAKVLGVSKWTAYDMLKEIEKSGYVTRSYEVNPNETGRSQVVFAPTEKATELFQQQRSNVIAIENWEETVHAIRQLLNSIKHNSIQDLLKKMLDEIPGKQSNLEFCGYLLGIFMAYVKKVGGRTETAIQRLIHKTSGHHTTLLMFAGTVMGTVIQTASEEMGSEIAELMGKCVTMIGDLSSREQELLSDFVKEALS
ncbi:Lrp/AsnC family transcriptional regulator [Paenibacillus enshidis]|uniref:Lrp/AsnC family transcriptional regulator n=1 Tax=Paenibacillus enshidis TaxID=1458439 RepID=A0ABV5ARK6_9BACL